MKMDRRPWVLSTEFLKAIEEKNVKMVNAILDSGFDLDINLMFCKNAINICVSNGWYEMAQLLIQRGCSLSLKNDLGQQPLTIAVLKSDHRLVKLLLDNRADKTSMDLQGKSALHYACELNSLRIVELLTSNASPRLINLPGHNRTTPLSSACEHGGVGLVNHLLSKDADVNAVDYFQSTPLFAAVRNLQCTPEMVEALLDAGADIHHKSCTSETVLLYALRTFSKHMAKNKYLSDARFQKICMLLVERGCDVDARNQQQETALHLAVHLGDATLARKLINSGCEVDPRDNLDLAPLFYAGQSAAPELVDVLVGAGACTGWFHTDGALNRWMWYNRGQHLTSEDSDFAVVVDLLRQALRCRRLSDSCRSVIRGSLRPDVEKRAKLLPLPQPLIKFVLLAN